MIHEPVFLAPLPALRFLDPLAEGMAVCGVSLLEIGAWDRGFDYDDLDGLARARKILEAAGVEAYSYHPPFAGQYDIAHLDQAKWEWAVERNRRQIRATAAIGAKYLVLHPSGHVKGEDHGPRLERIVAAIEKLLPTCDEVEVGLAVENLPPEYIASTIDELMSIVNAFGGERVGICFDTGHANLMSLKMSEAIARMGDRLFTIHWHDNDGTKDQHLPPGAAKIDWADFFAGLDALSWDRPVCPEFGPPEGWTYRTYVSRIRTALETNGTCA